MEHSCANTLCTHADQTWLAAFRRSVTTVADFIIAQLQDAADIHAFAKNVLCVVDGEFISVEDIERKCSNHGWNSMVYEAWAWERQNGIHCFARRLNQPERDALLLYAHYLDPLDASSSDAHEALAEARRELYGEELDDDDDDDADAFVDSCEESVSFDHHSVSSINVS